MNEETGGYDCYVAFFGNELPSGAPKQITVCPKVCGPPLLRALEQLLAPDRGDPARTVAFVAKPLTAR
jgi:hypothetical protein